MSRSLRSQPQSAEPGAIALAERFGPERLSINTEMSRAVIPVSGVRDLHRPFSPRVFRQAPDLPLRYWSAAFCSR